MKNRWWMVVCIALVATTAIGADWRTKLPVPEKVAQYLQDCSVTIKSGNAEGSGVLKTRTLDGQRITYVWTAAHVVADLRRVEEVIDPASGTKRQLVLFGDAAIVHEKYQNGRRVGEEKNDVKVVRYSKDEDLALLEVRERNFTEASVVFYLDPAIPAIGTRLLHVGSLLGQMGSNSMTSGIQSQIGRVLASDNREYDQTTVTAFPGSSGGGVYLENGAWCAMVTRGAGEQFNLVVPARRLIKWAKRAGIAWAVDDEVPMPTQDQLDKLLVEDAGATFSGTSVPQAPTPAPPIPPAAPSPPKSPNTLKTLEILK